MEKNETMVLQCSSLGTNGEGIVKTEGTTVFVPYMLPGERGEVKILKVKGNVGYGKLGSIRPTGTSSPAILRRVSLTSFSLKRACAR